MTKTKYVLGGAFFVGSLIACTVFSGGCSQTTSSVATPQTQTLQTVSYSDIPLFDNMKDLVQASDAVFIGQVINIAGTRNLARNPQDISQEDPNVYVEGVDYNVNVTEFLKGSSTQSNLLVTETKQSRLSKSQPMVPDEHYVGMQPGSTYVFFVKKSATTGRYYAAGQPFFFEITNKGVEIKTTVQELQQKYKTTDLISFKSQVQSSK